MTARGLAADLRALGRFAEALDIDKEILDKFKEQFGDEDPQTLSTAQPRHRYRFTATTRRPGSSTRRPWTAASPCSPRHPYTLTTKAAPGRGPAGARRLPGLGGPAGGVPGGVPGGAGDGPADAALRQEPGGGAPQGRTRGRGEITKETYARFLDNYGARAGHPGLRAEPGRGLLGDRRHPAGAAARVGGQDGQPGGPWATITRTPWSPSTIWRVTSGLSASWPRRSH